MTTALSSTSPARRPGTRWPAGVQPSAEFQSAIAASEEGDGLFITGRAGTGKSTLLRCLRANLRARTAVLAPTGLAAVNVQGQTIHSFFGFPPQFITPEVVKRARRTALLRNLDTLIIDEVSMVRADLMEGMDLALRIARKQTSCRSAGCSCSRSAICISFPRSCARGAADALRGELRRLFLFQCAGVSRCAAQPARAPARLPPERRGVPPCAERGARGQPSREALETFNERVMPFRSLPHADDYVVLTPINQAADQTNRAFLDRL